MSELKVFNPVALAMSNNVEPAPRDASLDGKRVALYWNGKSGGDKALSHVERVLSNAYSGLTFSRYQGKTGAGNKYLSEKEADEIAAECDVVVGTTSDCGSCTSWLVHDMIILEKRGLPSASLTAAGFLEDAKRSAVSFGLPSHPVVLVPGTFTNKTDEEIGEYVDGAFDAIVAGLTKSGEGGQVAFVSKVLDEQLSFTASTELDALRSMNDTFREYGWSDGFPMLPPTEQLMEEMLAGTPLDRSEVIATLEPGFGIATVEKIAANAVLAGCRPEHMPVLIAAIKCMADPLMSMRNKAMSTGPAAPLLIVNGPIREQLGINGGTCLFGPGDLSYANTVIGRAVRLFMMNIGHAYPGIADMDTQGSPTKYSMVVGELEDVSPWEPYHVERGYSADQSTVTMQFAYGICDVCQLQTTKPEEVIEAIASEACNLGVRSTGIWLMGHRGDPRTGDEHMEHDAIVIGPEHARLFNKHGWSKDDVRRAIWQKARMPFRQIRQIIEPKTMKVAHPELMWLWDSPEALVPVLEKPECFELVVAGGNAGRSTFMWGTGAPVTYEVQDLGA